MTTEKTAEGNNSQTFSQADHDKAIHRARMLEGELTTKEKELERYKKFGDPEDLAGKISYWENLEKEKAKTDPSEVDRIVQRTLSEKMKEANAQLQREKDRAEAAEKRAHQVEVVDAAMSIAARFIEPDLLPFVKETHLKTSLIKDEDGDLVALGKDGKPRYDGTKKVLAEDFINELIKQSPSLALKKPSNNNRVTGEIKAVNRSSGIDEAHLRSLGSKAERVKYRIEHEKSLKKQG